MNLKLLKVSAVLCVMLILTLPGIVKATTLGTANISHVGYYAFEKISVWGGGREDSDIHAGVYMFDKFGGTFEGNLWPNGYSAVTGFCIELAEPHAMDLLKYDVIMPQDGPLPTTLLGSTMGLTKAKYIQELWGRYYDPSWASGGYFTAQQNHEAATFAVAIWEIVHEDLPGSPLNWDVMSDGTLGEGGFMTDSDFSLANEWLYSLDGTGPVADLRVFSYDGYQDYIVEVPEPATIALLGTGVLASMLRRRKNVFINRNRRARVISK